MTGGYILSAPLIFDGESWIKDHALVITQGRISRIIPCRDIPAGENTRHYPDAFIAPAFIDLQIYGAAGKLLAVYPEPASLKALQEENAAGGTAWCLPAVATNTPEVFYACIDAVRRYWQGGGKGILGLHLEGPWLNPVKRGAHIESLIHPPDQDEVNRLLEYGKGIIRMITLAPEICSPGIIRRIREAGIVVSAGHSNATYPQAVEGFEAGITAVTHLFNAMSPFQHREPGLAGAAMDYEKVMASIIPDGYHTDFAAVRIAKKAMGERLFAITDAVTETSKGAYPHQLRGDRYESGGVLSGSALSMIRAFRNLEDYAGISREEALRMCSLYPARVMGLDNDTGKIKPGSTSALVVINNLRETEDLVYIQ